MELTLDSKLTSFEHRPRTGLLYGPGAIERVPELLREAGAKSLLLVTDPGIVQAGHAQRLRRMLEDSGFEILVYDGVEENPSTRCVRECAATVQGREIDWIVALGGGSPIDAAKGCNFLITNGGRIEDYRGSGKAAHPLKPMVAIPTTAGTGSEVQRFALISDKKTRQKMACGDASAAPKLAVLDPVLTLTQPFSVAACTGIDTLAHAVETAVTRNRNAFSLMFSHQAFRFAVEAFPSVLRTPNDLEARGRMLLAATFGGLAIENSMLGAAHSAANPLTTRFGIVHGQAVGMMLPWIVRHNAEDPEALEGYRTLAQAAGLAGPDDPPDRAFERLRLRLEEMLRLAGFPGSLRECGVDRSQIADLAEEAAGQWTAQFNPRPMQQADFESIYQAAWVG